MKNNVENLAIIGAGGHARAVFSWLNDSNVEFSKLCFIDQYIKEENENIFQYPIIQKDWDKIDQINAISCVLAIGDNELREQLFEKLKKCNKLFVNVIHNSAVIGLDVYIGKGVSLGPLCILGPLVCLYDNVIVNSGAIVEHESIVGSHSHIAPGSKVAGRVVIGSNVLVGIGAIIKENITIGNNVIIGAGAVVVNDIPNNSVVAGVPAKIIRKLD